MSTTIAELLAVDVGHLATALDGVYGFHHERSGIRAEVTIGRREDDRLHAEGLLYVGSEVVGDFTRCLEWTGSVWIARHIELELDENAQRKGFGRAYLEHLIRWYRANDVVRIELRTDMEAGGFVWAALGFDWDRSKPETLADIQRIAARLRWRAQRRGDRPAGLLADRLQAELDAGRVVLRPDQIARLGEIGSDTMMGTTWNGVMELR